MFDRRAILGNQKQLSIPKARENSTYLDLELSDEDELEDDLPRDLRLLRSLLLFRELLERLLEDEEELKSALK